MHCRRNVIKSQNPKINKLRIIEWIKVDMKWLMSIFLGLRIDEEDEMDKRLSNHNYGHRKYFSLELALLEKSLISD